MSQSKTVGNEEHSSANKLTVAEEVFKVTAPSAPKLQLLIQPKVQKARKTFPSSCSVDRHQHELNLAGTISLNLSSKRIEYTQITEKVPAACEELDPAVSKQKLLTLMKNEFGTPVKKFTNETEWKDLPVVLQKQKTEDPSSLNTKVPDQNQVAAERLSIKASPEEVCELKASSSLQMHSQNEEDDDNDVMDVEAAIAALHGEVLEDTTICKIFKVASIPEAAVREDSEDQIPIAPVEHPVIKPPSKKMNGKKRKGRLSAASSKLGSFSTGKDELATSASSSPSTKSVAPKTSSGKRRNAAMRELNGLFIDEGAIHMLCEMEKRGRSGRRSGSFNETACLIPKELLGDKILKNIRTTRMQRVIEKRQSLPARSSALVDDDGVPDRLAFSPAPVTVPQVSNATDRDRTSPGIVSLSSSSHSTYSNANLKPEGAPASKKMKSSHSGPVTFSNSPVSLESELNAFSKDFTQFNVNSAESGIPKTTETTLSHYAAECREIVVRLNDPLVHVVLCSKSSISPCAINPGMLHELTELLRLLNSEDSIRVVLFTSAGPDFCTGIDLALLISHSQSDRLQAANRMAGLIKDFVLALVNCDKLLVAGLTGSAVGLGVTILPYFDVVYASDKATFQLPYVQLGQGTEGGLPLTFHNYAASNQLIGLLFYEGRCLTATEAQGHGLVHSVLWPSSFQEDLLTRIHRLTTQTTKQCLATKRAIRASLRRDLPPALLEESQLLVKSWISDEFQTRAQSHAGATKTR